MSTPDARLVTPRDPYLDSLKGIAIIIVVLGHSLQTPDFDNYLPWRVVVSFHMPMFMFVSGMVASFSFQRDQDKRAGNASQLLMTILFDMYRKSTRLLTPFISWAFVLYFFRQDYSISLYAWIIKVLTYPDNGLWFLLVLFECSAILVIASATAKTVLWVCRRFPSAKRQIFVISVYIISGITADQVLNILPYSFGMYLTRIYFPYFFSGLIFHLIAPRGITQYMRLMPYLVFASLVPFWYRLQPSVISNYFSPPLAQESAEKTYKYIVAFAGTASTVDLARLCNQILPRKALLSLALIGSRSLDIYPLHFLFLNYKPMVVAPLLISLGVSYIMRSSRVLTLVFFGQATRPRTLRFLQILFHRLVSFFDGTVPPPLQSGAAPKQQPHRSDAAGPVVARLIGGDRPFDAGR